MKNSDDRIHCIFYLLAPHRIKLLDMKFLEEICIFAPIVPVIAKADALTFLERKRCLLEVSRLIDHISHRTGKQVVFDFREDGGGFLADHHAKRGRPPARGGRMVGKEEEAQSSDLLSRATMVTSSFSSTYVDLAGSQSVDLSLSGESGVSVIGMSATKENTTGAANVPSPLVLPTHDCGSEHSTPRSQLSQEEIQYGLSHMGESLGFSNVSDISAHGALPMVANVFAVVCAAGAKEEREYPWGAVDINDHSLSDFRRLQRLVVESDHITEMISHTQDVSIRLAAARSHCVASTFAACAWDALVSSVAPHPASCVKTADCWQGSAKTKRRAKAAANVTLLLGLLLIVGAAGSALYRLLFLVA